MFTDVSYVHIHVTSFTTICQALSKNHFQFLKILVQWKNKLKTRSKCMYRLFFLTGGFISLSIGIVGIILPVIPTTPLLLLSGFCFARSSKKFESWLRKTKVYQFYVSDYAESKAISAKRKKHIIWQIYLLMGISIWLAPLLWIKIGLFLLTLFITYYLFKVIPTK